MRLLRHRWWAVAGLLLAWIAAWVFLWQACLFDLFDVKSEPGMAVFTERSNAVRRLWAAAGVGLAVGGGGALVFAAGNVFRRHSTALSHAWRVAGATVILAGLSLPILFPSSRSIVIDERNAIVSIDERWLYAKASDGMAFGDIARVWLYMQRKSVGRGETAGCLISMQVSLIGHDRTVLDLPGGIPHEAVAAHLVEATGSPIVVRGVQEC